MSKERFCKLPALKHDPQGKPLCRLCGGTVPKGRRSWCGDACVKRYLIMSDANAARRAVWLRDKGICALCGTDTDAIRAHLRFLSKSSRDFNNPLHRLFQETHERFLDYLKTRFNKARKSGDYWQADHITPVCEGGGHAGLEGYRTLCTPCHKLETAKLAQRRALKRLADHDAQHELWEEECLIR